MENEVDVIVNINVDNSQLEMTLSSIAGKMNTVENLLESVASKISECGSLVVGSINEMAVTLEMALDKTATMVAEKIGEFCGVYSEAQRNQSVSDASQIGFTIMWDMLKGGINQSKKTSPTGNARGSGGNAGGTVLALPPGNSIGTDTQSSSGIVDLVGNADVLSAGLSELVELWDSEAAAKALSTAATTAWNAVCSVGTTIAGAFGAAINFLTSPIGVVVMAITALIAIIVLLVANWDTVKAAFINGWETVKAFLGTAAEWFNTAVIQPVVGFLTALWTRITTFVSGLMVLLMPYIQQFMLLVQTVLTNIQTFFAGLGEYLTGVFSVNWAEQFGAFGEVLNVFFAAVQEIWTAVQTIFEGIIQFVTGVFSGDWESAWNGIVQIFSGIWEGLETAVKTPINGVIGLINGLVKAVVSGINGAIDALNTLRFTVPDWVPEIGGKYFGFNIGKISAPQIPYLAQGAVLPANRPFLAVVGDQKHGTNVEAPLETIQQALANVLAQQGTQDIRITFTGDLAQLARVLKPQLDRENRRVGGSLARGVTV